MAFGSKISSYVATMKLFSMDWEPSAFLIRPPAEILPDASIVDRFRYAKDADYVRTFPTDACRPSLKAGALGNAVKTSKPTSPPSLRRLPKLSGSTLPRHDGVD